MTPATESNPRVLLVETDDALVSNVSLDLKESGYEMVLAQDANSALRHAIETQPALIVVDRMLAGESGLSLCHAHGSGYGR
jgi:two-component system, OmpR family, response regulator NblR